MGICRILDQIITSEIKKRLYFIKYNRFFVLVAGTGLEPVTFGL